MDVHGLQSRLARGAGTAFPWLLWVWMAASALVVLGLVVGAGAWLAGAEWSGGLVASVGGVLGRTMAATIGIVVLIWASKPVGALLLTVAGLAYMAVAFATFGVLAWLLHNRVHVRAWVRAGLPLIAAAALYVLGPRGADWLVPAAVALVAAALVAAGAAVNEEWGSRVVAGLLLAAALVAAGMWY